MAAEKTWLDRAISYVNPQLGARRAQARVREAYFRQVHSRYFEGASNGDRFKNWKSPGTSANAETLRGLVPLRNRSRDLVRNNTYAERAVRTIQSHTIGTGIMYQFRVTEKGRAAERALSDAKQLWADWAETRECDADGRLDMYGLQALVMRTIAQDGEVLIRRRRRFASDKLTIPVQLQVLESDFLDTTRDGATASGGVIIQGIEYDAVGRRVAYWLFREHPGEAGSLRRGFTLESSRVPAEDVEHLYRVDRAGQVRGIPFGTSCIVKLRDFDDYEDAQLVRQKVAAAFAGYIQDTEVPDPIAIAKEQTELSNIEPGTIELLPPGKSITFPSTPSVQDDGHSSRVLHSVATGFGVSYESLTGDFSNVTFSSARMARIDFWLNLDQWQYQMVIPGMCAPAFKWFKEGALLMGVDSSLIHTTYTPPRRQMVDPTKEVPARIKEIRGGLKSLSEAIRENGDDPEEHFAQLKADNEAIDSAGLILDSDPRKTQGAGGVQQGTDASASSQSNDSEGGN